MRAVVQRVARARVTVDGREIGSIGAGILLLLGVHRDDAAKDVERLVDKVIHLRIFEDEKGLMNRSLMDTGGEMLVVSQFTLLGDCRRGRRPSWSQAASPEKAGKLYEEFVAAVRRRKIRVATGKFQARMDVSLTNTGPVTLLLDSRKAF